MTELKAYTLASSSKGNAVYVRYGEDELLIDAGISARRLEAELKSLGSSLDNISAIFITHEHSDHVASLATYSKKHRAPIHMTEDSAMEYLASGKGSLPSAVIHPPIFTEQVGAIGVQSFPTSHDSRCSVGYVIRAGCESLALATDLGCVTEDVRHALTGVERVILESNHDEGMLMCGAYPYQLKRRILSDRGHLSNETAALFARDLANSGTKRILLAHLSPDNNHPELALATARLALKGTNCTVAVAAQCGATEI